VADYDYEHDWSLSNGPIKLTWMYIRTNRKSTWDTWMCPGCTGTESSIQSVQKAAGGRARAVVSTVHVVYVEHLLAVAGRYSHVYFFFL
jgi:hypothetical protein